MTTIYWAGDSTVKENSILTYPQTGMGQVFGRLCGGWRYGWRTTPKTAAAPSPSWRKGALETIRERMQPGDFLFIQFGHNDEKAEDPARYTSPEDTFPGIPGGVCEGGPGEGRISRADYSPDPPLLPRSPGKVFPRPLCCRHA